MPAYAPYERCDRDDVVPAEPGCVDAWRESPGEPALDRVEVALDKRAAALGIGASTLLAVVAFAMLGNHRVVEACGLLFCAGLAAFLVFVMADPRPGLVFDGEALWINPKVGRSNRIPWAQVVSASVIGRARSPGSVLVIKFRKMTASGRDELHGESVGLGLLAIDRTALQKLVDEFRARSPETMQRAGPDLPRV